MKVAFVLVEPAVPENIGAAARAIKTMGFTELRMVNPANHLADKARWLAHGSGDVLDSAKIFSSLAEAIADLDFTIGTTAKNRSTKADYHAPEIALQIAKSKEEVISGIGIVFGREESGLTNEELRQCDIASTIQLANPYPSINLAQSVMIYAYIFSNLILFNKNTNVSPGAKEPSAPYAYTELKNSTARLLSLLEIDRNENLYYRMLERVASASADDTKLLLSFVKKALSKFDKN